MDSHKFRAVSIRTLMLVVLLGGVLAPSQSAAQTDQARVVGAVFDQR